jgi:hypothetical protein
VLLLGSAFAAVMTARAANAVINIFKGISTAKCRRRIFSKK